MKKSGDGKKPDKKENLRQKNKPEKKKPRKDREKEKNKAAKSKKWDEVWLPIIVIVVILLAMVLLIYISSKTGERIKKADLRDTCFQRFKSDSDIIMTLVSYQREKGEYPEKLESIREFLKDAEPESAQSGKINSIEKDLYNTWKRFYCPSGEDDYSMLYTYLKPPDSAPDDFIVVKCPVHPDHTIRMVDLRKAERSPKEENSEKLP